MDIFRKAQKHASLTPSERALLKLLWSLTINGLTTGLLAAGGYLMAPGMIDLQNLAYIVIIAVVFSIAHGVAKYVSAHGDPPLGAAIDVAVTAAEQRVPLPRVRNPASMDTLPNVPITQPPRPTQHL